MFFEEDALKPSIARKGCRRSRKRNKRTLPAPRWLPELDGAILDAPLQLLIEEPDLLLSTFRSVMS